MASQPNSTFLTMLAELHQSASDTFGAHFPRKCEEPQETSSVTNQANSTFLAMLAELHQLASCMRQVHQQSHT